MNASVIARIAKIVPLAVVTAVGVAACTSAGTGSQAAPTAARSAAPAVSAPASPVVTPAAPTASPTAPAVTPAPTASPTADPAAPAPVAVKTPAARTSAAKSPRGATGTTAAPARKPAASGGLGITFDGLAEGRRIQVGDTVSFSVTWQNDDASGSRTVAPVVATQPFDGSPCTRGLSMAQGTLERKDASGWTSLPLSQGGGMDYATTGDGAAFTLGAGQRRTVEYRMRLDASDRPGKLVVEADAAKPGSFGPMPRAEVGTVVVDAHRPAVTSVSAPGPLVVGTGPTEFGFRVSSPDGPRGLRPSVHLSAAVSAGVAPSDVTVEAKVGNEWKRFDAVEDCDGEIGVAPSELTGVFAGGPGEYLFRIGVKKPWQGGAPLEIEVGAVSDGHYGDTVAVRPSVRG